MDKQELRQHIRTRKRAMTVQQIEEKSKKLQELFLKTEAYRNAKTIYGYLPYNQEVRTAPILQQALDDGKAVAIAKCYDREMRFILVDNLQCMDPDSRIPQPLADAPVGQDPTALVLMPGMAFTKQGQRMGYGGGFYDRFLAAEPDHPTVALCFDFQIVDQIPTEDYDIPADLVLWA